MLGGFPEPENAMANLNDCPCIRCIGDEKRITEEFASEQAAVARIVDMTAKGMLFNSCQCGEAGRAVFLVCYHGLPTNQGVLPRYEGEPLAVP